MTRFFGERVGPEIHIPSIRGFNDLIRSLRLIEPPLVGRSFTRTSDWQPPICKTRSLPFLS